ncbi:MAG: winged helix-turn-helix domain-containing protein [Synechococcus sp.]|nr:winged helix-turn-helix domain-containing protein [Synechococcus sp.]
MVTYRFGPFCVKDNESLWINDTLVPLSPLQLRLLSYLCSHPQQVLDKERIVANVWGRRDVSDVSLARAIHGLRSRLSAGSRANELIRNIYGRGYMLTQPVIVSAERPSATMDLLHAQVAAAAAAPMVRSGAEQDRLIPVVPSLQRSNLRAVN